MKSTNQAEALAGEQLIQREGSNDHQDVKNGIYDYKTRLLFTYVRSAGECDPMSRARFRHKPIECAGERQFAKSMLDRQFPSRHGTEENFVGRVREDLARRL
jgi:hypothetical protein